jgi:hypothetical protein
MNSWVPTALAVALIAVCTAAPADAGSCLHSKSRNCLKLPASIDFSSVPDISNQIVGGKATVQPSLPDLPAPQSETPYTGPMVGISTKARAPTVGYYWSIN